MVVKRIYIVLFCLYLIGCASPSVQFRNQAEQLNFTQHVIKTTQFEHVIFSKQRLLDSPVLHVYLDGDGTPWERQQWIAVDPTARNPIILRLMAMDSTPAILLGRPCYYGLSQHVSCHNRFWTSHRYSKQIVISMVQALKQWLTQHPYQQIVLIGYSGGGALAVLMAKDIRQISKVVTVSANLNLTEWSRFHGYLPLNGSLDPNLQPLIADKIEQFHFAGKDDKNVPAGMIKEFANKQLNAHYYELSGQNHSCCWENIWPDLLYLIKSAETIKTVN